MSYTTVEGSSFEPSAKGCVCSVSSKWACQCRFPSVDVAREENLGHASSITSISFCASSAVGQRMDPVPSSFERISSIREESSCGANARPVKRLQAVVL